jgi:purine-nucleoside phosphorylase
MKSLPDFFQLDRFNISPTDVTRGVFQCDPKTIHPDVILMPWWQPEVFGLWANRITAITNHILYELDYKGRVISVIRSGIGAPQAGDMVLALGCTDCERLIFAGSVGGLRSDIQIGDLMIPDFSYSGDGFCRYLEPDSPQKDCMLEMVPPDETLSLALLRSASHLAQEAGIKIHTGPIFSIDSILSQFRLLDYFSGVLGCIGIEMETAAVFKAARMVGIQAAALFSVSDVPVIKKTLYAGRLPEERNRRKDTRSRVLAKALLDCLFDLPLIK